MKCRDLYYIMLRTSRGVHFFALERPKMKSKGRTVHMNTARLIAAVGNINKKKFHSNIENNHILKDQSRPFS